jgi:hypothetical protein
MDRYEALSGAFQEAITQGEIDDRTKPIPTSVYADGLDQEAASHTSMEVIVACRKAFAQGKKKITLTVEFPSTLHPTQDQFNRFLPLIRKYTRGEINGIKVQYQM